MIKEDLKYIEIDGKRLYYRLNLQPNPVGLPLLIVLHGHGSKPTAFRHEGWNVLSPLDDYGYNNDGTWWLGENGDFFIIKLLQELIHKIRLKYNVGDQVYFYGSSMGGYGAILHGIMCNAKAVYSNVPQIKLKNTKYFERNLTKQIKFTLGEDNSDEICDLTVLLRNHKHSKLPTFFLCENTVEIERKYEDYLKEHSLYFAKECLNMNLPIHLELLPQSGHTKNYGLKEVLQKFQKFVIFPESSQHKQDYLIVEDDSIDKRLAFTSYNWFVNNNLISSVTDKDNTLTINISENDKVTPFYLISGDKSLSKPPKININIEKVNAIEVNFEFKCKDTFNNYKLFLLEFVGDDKVKASSSRINQGKNQILFSIANTSTSFKLAFHTYTSNEKNEISLKNMKIVFFNDDKIIELDDDSDSIITDNKYVINKESHMCSSKEELQDIYIYCYDQLNHILKLISEKLTIGFECFLLRKNPSISYDSFKPRKDSKTCKLFYPIDWRIDPFNERNWRFQLHSWRMLDNLMLDYMATGDISSLKSTVDVIANWEKFHISQLQESDLSWQDMATGLRALKLGFLIQELVKNLNIVKTEYILMLIRLAYVHISELSQQKIADNNHGMFQAHGLSVLSYLLDDDINLQKGVSIICELLSEQFFNDGAHSENSDDYHWLVLRMLKEMSTFYPYSKNKDFNQLINNATLFSYWTCFPNNKPILIGDTGDSNRKIEFDMKFLKEYDKNVNMKFFEDSGFFFIRSSFEAPVNKSFMVFFQTAYKNRVHRHADDFNILYFEYGKEILVDSGKYSYDYESSERKYVTSTRAHNCVLIDDHNYECQGALYYNSALEKKYISGDFFVVSSSITRKDIDVNHSRIIIYTPRKFLIVIDYLKSETKRDFKQLWHINHELDAMVSEDTFDIKITDNIQMNIKSRNYIIENSGVKELPSSIYKIKGQKDPELQGWRSIKYRKIVENDVVVNASSGTEVLLTTQFCFSENQPSVLVDNNDGSINITVTDNDECLTHNII